MEETRIEKILMYFEGRINISDYLVVEEKETQEESGIQGGCSRPEKIGEKNLRAETCFRYQEISLGYVRSAMTVRLPNESTREATGCAGTMYQEEIWLKI